MLWLCIRLPLLPREALAATRAAQRQPRLERAALERLAWWALQWSSQVSLHDAGPDDDSDDAALWLEIGASETLLGPADALRETVRAALQPLGYTARLAVAPTPRGALLLTRTHHPATIRTLDALRQALAPLPLPLLALPAATIAALHAAGLRRIGELSALPWAALARRFGADASRYLQRLYGNEPDPLLMVALPPAYRSRCGFDGELADTTALLFPLQRMLWEFQGYLRARDCGVQRFLLQLEHRLDHETTLSVGLSQPGRDAAQLFGIARERLAGVLLAAPVRALRIEADAFTAPGILQGDFFSRDREQAQQLAQALDRLTARLGPASISRLEILDDHRPERAWRAAAANVAGLSLRPDLTERLTGSESKPVAVTTLAASSAAARPCWLLPQPTCIPAPATLVAGPERIESGWWDGADVARDYFIARDPQGARQWVFQDLRSGQWFLHGLWA